MKNALVIAFLAVLVVFSIAQAQTTPASSVPTQAAVHGFDYRCGDVAVSLRLHEGKQAELQIGTTVLGMQTAAAASGNLYTATERGQGDVALHTQDDGAILTRDGVETPCRLAKADAGTTVAEDQTAAQARVEIQKVSLTSTDWQLESVDGAPLSAGTSASLRFENGQVSGNGGCNRFGGSYSQNGPALTFGDIMATRMACDVPRMELELRVHDRLRQVDGYVIDESGALALKKGTATLMTLRPAAVVTPAKP